MSTGVRRKRGDDLRELAHLVGRDRIPSRILSHYLECITEGTLIEFDANTRICSRWLSETYPGLSSGELAGVLISKADEVDRSCI
jgi:hypothetical protein